MHTPAPVTLGRVTRLFALIADLMVDAVPVEAGDAMEMPIVGATLADLVPDEAFERGAVVNEGPALRIDPVRLVEEIAQRGLLMELATILYDVTAEEAKELPIEAIEEALCFFLVRAASPVEALHGFVSDLA